MIRDASAPAQFFRFLLVGIANTAATYLAYLLMLNVVPYLVAYTLAYGLGLLISYVLNSRIVFQKRVGAASPAGFVLIYAGQYLLGVVLLWFLVAVVGLAKEIALLVVIAVSVPLTFAALRLLFARSSERTVARTGSEPPASA